MDKRQYFIHSAKEEFYLSRAWLFACFAIIKKTTRVDDDEDLLIEDGRMFVVVDEETVPITDWVLGQPLFGVDERVTFNPGDLPNVKEKVETTYGIAVMNLLLFVYAYGDKVPYLNGEMTPGMVNDIAYKRLKETKDVDAHLRFENGGKMIEVFSNFSVPTLSPKTIQPPEKILERRDALLEKHKDQLDDPVVVANIQKELAGMLRDYLKDDPSGRFFLKGKHYDVSLLRTFVMYGSEPDFYDESKISVMKPSLIEGWEKENIPMLINVARGGSHARGASTALGGAEVKLSTRIFQNYDVTEEDCGTTDYLPILIHTTNKGKYIGRYVVGRKTPLTESDLNNAVGTSIKLRSPTACKTNGTKFCRTCMGDVVSKSGVSLNGHTTTAISELMLLFMSMMHTTALSLNRFDYKRHIR